MKIDMKRLEQSFIDADKFVSFTRSPNFGEFYKAFDLIEARARFDVLQSYKSDADTMRAAVAYLKAIEDLRKFFENAEQNYKTIHDKIHELKNLAAREQHTEGLNNQALGDIIRR